MVEGDLNIIVCIVLNFLVVIIFDDVRGFMSCSEICFFLLVIGVNLWNLIGVLISVLCGGKFRIYYSFICLFVVYVGD